MGFLKLQPKAGLGDSPCDGGGVVLYSILLVVCPGTITYPCISLWIRVRAVGKEVFLVLPVVKPLWTMAKELHLSEIPGL